MGVNYKSSKLFIIDFGLAKRVIKGNTYFFKFILIKYTLLKYYIIV